MTFVKHTTFLIDFFFVLEENLKEKERMKDVFKSLFTLLLASSAFFIGFYLGKEKIISKIPDFQEDSEKKA